MTLQHNDRAERETGFELSATDLRVSIDRATVQRVWAWFWRGVAIVVTGAGIVVAIAWQTPLM